VRGGGANVVVDAGPIVAWLSSSDQHHRWVHEQFARLRPPLLTCEPVLTEAAFILRAGGGDAGAVAAMAARAIWRVVPVLSEHAAAVAALMRRYANVPMSFTDACLVRLSETVPNATVFTLDTDFRIYRRRGRAVIPVLMPPDR
jgi:predicted nucleic acid-binding protein